MKRIVFIFAALAAILMNACTSRQVNTDKYLRQMRERLDAIQSASYIGENLDYLPGSPIPRYHEFLFRKEYKNASDTTVGASFLHFADKEGTELRTGYDGEATYSVWPEYKGIVRNDFTARNLPYRVVSNPFFRNAYHILDYALTTNDSIEYTLADSVDYYKFHLITHEEEQVEFLGGKAHHILGASAYVTDPTSEYEIWFSKQTDLPYRIKRTQSHDISEEITHDVVLNAENPADFNINDYLPQGYTIRPYRVRQRSVADANDLLNKPAPLWSAADFNGDTYSLSDLHAKVILQEFSATACGPCQAAIPFLEQLRSEYGKDDLLIISFESWGANDSTMKVYAEQKGLTYPYIRATEQMLSDYKTGGSAPWFFLLDQNLFVRKVWYGFTEGTTDKEICEAIKEML